ncbi:MAG: hypothetical protein ACJAVJ_000196 [Planctomycetota bacterium]|jgi:hypothetical protein
MRTILKTTLTLALLAQAASAGTIYVDANLTTGLDDGSSWANAIQSSIGVKVALAAATSGDDIYVADGTYLASSGLTRSDSFQLINGVTLYGGFLGGEASPADRPAFGTAPSILSGDLAGDDALGSFGDNSFHIIRTAGTNATAVIDGFDVVGGNANSAGSNNDRGGGILCDGNVSPTVRNCRFIANRSTFGGAAGYCNNGAAPSFTDCTFQDGVGGAFGGAFDIAFGGAVRFERCLFQGNTANRAGALEIFSTNGVLVTNCIFRNNTATGGSGGGAIWVGSGGNTRFANCTIVGNTATSQAQGGMRNQGAGSTVVRNSIFWNNQGPGGAMASANQLTGSINATYCIVQGGLAGTGNLSADPQFDGGPSGDLRLKPTSPAVDAGNNNAPPAGSVLDFGGNPRNIDLGLVPDTGFGSAPIIDFGAFEVQGAGFTSVAGCFGNPLALTSTSPALAPGTALGLTATSAVFTSGFVFYYAGSDGTALTGCGVNFPGVGEVLLGLGTTPYLLGSSAMALGTSSLNLNIPPLPGFVGVEFAFQAAAGSTTLPGGPLELSNLLLGVLQP